MKEEKKDYVISITDPMTEQEAEFALEDDFNVSMVVRLIRKREKLKKSSRETLRKAQDIRDKHNVNDLDNRVSEVSMKIQNAKKKEEETEEEFKKRYEELGDEIRSLRDAYPDEFLDLNNELQEITDRVEIVGQKLCTKMITPLNGIPSEYKNEEEYISELLFDSETQDLVIDFFLKTYSSTMMSQREPRGVVKIQKKK